ncbi:Scr1 family TA system antitoxin-like transcriptional regulator [Micromonosporaceae bacterium Da 78-11]
MSTADEWSLVPRQQFGLQLRELRLDAALEAQDLAARLGVSADLISRIELGERWPSKASIVEAWARVTGHEEQATELVKTRDELKRLESKLRAEAHEPWVVQKLRSDLFRKASRIRTFAVTDIPFYLQTAEYARIDMGETAGAAKVVSMRQEANAAVGASGKYFEIILAESALRFAPCDARTMRGQLSDLQSLVGLPGVEIGIIPFGGPITTALRGAFTVFDDVTLAESYAGAIDLTSKHAQRYIDLMERLWEDAVRGEAVREYLTAAANALPAS